MMRTALSIDDARSQRAPEAVVPLMDKADSFREIIKTLARASSQAFGDARRA